MIQTPNLVDIAARLSNESDAYISGFLEVRKDAPSPTYQRLISILKRIIDRSYTDGVDRFLSVKVDDAGNISGYFADGTKTIEFSLKGNNLSTKLARVRTDSLAVKRFDRKKRNCQKGHPCKGSCIAKNKTCLAKLGEVASPGEVAQLRQAAVNLKLEQNAANKPPEAPTPPKQDYEINPDTGKPYTIRELKKVASQKGVVGYSNMNTEELKQSIKFVDETPPEQQQRLAKTITSDRSTGNRAINASGVRGREKRSLQDSNRTWKNLQTLAKFAGTQPVGWGAAAIGAFLLGASIRTYERAKGEYRSHFKEAAEEAQERAANLGSSKNGLIQRTQKNNITFLISAGKGAGSDAIQKEFEKYKDSEDEGDRWLANNHHFIPFNLKESGAKPGGNDIENSVNGLTDYLTNFKRGKDQDAVDLAAQIYAYGIQRKQPESVATGLRKIQNRYETLIKQEGRLQARVENLQQLVERENNPIQKRVLESRLAIAQSAVVKSQNQKRNNRTAYAKLEKEGDKKLKPALANKGKNINILAHSRSGQTSKTALEYLARMQLPGEPTGKEVLEQVNLVMLGTPHFGFTENVSKRQRTLISAQDPISTLPVFGEGARQQWISTVKGHGWRNYLDEPRAREAIREVFGYYEDSLLERRRREEKAKTKGDSIYLDSYLRTLVRIDARKAVCKTGKPCKTKSGKFICIPKSHKCASEGVGLAQSETPFYQNRNFQIGLAAVGVSSLMVGGAIAGAIAIVKKDLKKSSVDFNSIRQPPGGIPDAQTLAKYDKLQPGDLIRKNFKSDRMGTRSHYAVYVGKDPKTGEHTLIDTGEDWKSRDSVPYVRSRGLTWDAGPNDTEYEKVPPEEMNLVKGTKQLSREEIVERSQKMLYQTFKYEGFESNCEAFARGIVEGKAYSSQGLKVSPLTNFTSRIVTDKVLTLRTQVEGDKARAFNAEGEAVKAKVGSYQFTGVSDYAKDKYKMTASQMVDFLEREAVMAERRKWEEKANPYSGAIETGYLTHLQESQKEATKAGIIKEQDKNLLARNTIKPFNRFAITVRVDKVNKDSEVEDFLVFLGMRSPEEFTKIVEQISEPFGEMKEAIQIKLYKDYLLMLFALLNQDLGVKADSYWEGFNSVRLDNINCEKGKPCKTKDGGKVCIPKTHKCASEISDDAKKKIAIAGGVALGVGAIGVIGVAAVAAKSHIEKANFKDYIETPDEMLSPELKAQKAYLQGQIDVATESVNSLRQQEEAAKKNFEKSKSNEDYIKYKCAFLERTTKEDDVFNLKFNITANGHKARKGETSQPDLANSGRKVFIARHGEREDYATPGFKPQRKYDNPLSANGIEQAKEMGASLKNKGVTEIYASPFLRTIQTANAVAEELDLPIKVEYGMAEWHNPHWFAEKPKPMSSEELQKLFPRIDTSYNSEQRPKYPENSDDVLDRASKTVNNAISRSSGNVLLVGHGPTVIGGTKSLAKDSPITLPQFAGVAEIENQNGEWKSNGLWHPTTNKKPVECRNKNDNAEIKADSNPTCKKGKTCKTKSGKVVCIPKSHKCSNENNKDKNLKVAALAGGVALAGVGVAALVGGIALKDAFKPDIQILRRQEDEVFDKKTPLKGRVINEIPLESTDPTSYLKIPDNKSFVEPEFPNGTKVKKAGVVVIEPDGRFWIMEPLNHVGGTHNFAKGTVEDGLSIQQNALKEAKEELGLDVKIVDRLGDFGDNSGKNYKPDMDGSKEPIARYYIGVRTGGTPNDAHWEADKVKLVSSDSARNLFRQGKDWRDYSVIQSAADYTSDEPSRMKLADAFVQAEKDAASRARWKPTMSPQEAEDWAKDSAYKDDLYHGTSKKSADKIEQEGFRTDIKLWGSYYGRGVYAGRDLGDIEPYAKKHGENATVLKLKANLKNVLYVDRAIDTATQQQNQKEYLQKNWGPSTMKYIARHMNFEEDFHQAVEREKNRKRELSNELKLGHITKEQYNQRVSDNPESEAFSQLIQRAGYDAVTYHDSVFQQKKEFLIFDRKKVVTTGRVKPQYDSIAYWDSYSETMSRFDGRGKRCGKGYIPVDAECKQGQSQIPKRKVRLRTPVTPVAALAGAAAIGLAGGVGIAAAKGSVKGQLKEVGTDKRIANLEYQTAEAKRKEVQTRLRQSEAKLNELKEKEDKLTVKQKNLEGKLLDVTKTLAEAAQESGAPQALTGILANEVENILKKDSTRSDGRGKPCGKGFIPVNAKCKQGQSQVPQAKLKSPSASGTLATVAIVALGAAGGAAAIKEINGIKQDLTQLKTEKAEVQKLREATEAEIEKAKQQEVAIAANQQEIANKETNLKKLEEEDKTRKEKAEDMGALRRVATSAVKAGATAGMAGAALGPQGALVAGGAAAGLAASKTAAVELAKAVRRKKPDNLKNRAIAAVAESLPTGIESVAKQQVSGETAKSIVKESAQKLKNSNRLADEILATAAESIAEGIDEGAKTEGDLTTKGKVAGKRSVNTAKNIIKNRFKFFDSLSTILHLDGSQILSVHLDNNAISGKALIDDTIWDYKIEDSKYQLNFNREDSVLFDSVLGTRFDAIKCGKGWISAGEKCRSGQVNPQKSRFLRKQFKTRPISRALGDIANEIDNATVFAAARKKQIQEELAMRGKQLKNNFVGGSTKKSLRSLDDKLMNLEDKLANMSESSRRSVEGVAEGVKRKLEELKQSGRRNQRR